MKWPDNDNRVLFYWQNIPQLLKAGSVRRFHRSFSAYFSILSDASTETTSNPSSSNMIESTLKCTQYHVKHTSREMIEIQSWHLPRSTGHVQNPLAVVLAQEVHEEITIVVGARSLVADKHLPHLGRLAIGVLVTYTFGGDARRAGFNGITLRHHSWFDWTMVTSTTDWPS